MCIEHAGVHAQSGLTLRGGSIVVDTENCTTPPSGLDDTVEALAFANTVGGFGQEAREEFSEAYVCRPIGDSEQQEATATMPDYGMPLPPAGRPGGTLLQLCNATNPLESFMYVEANNTFVLIDPTTDFYESLGVRLVQNNTLAIEDVISLTLYRSSIDLNAYNWFEILNSTVALNNSRIM